MWKNIVEGGRSHMTIWRMRIACWISNATNTHSEYVILIVFLQQQWLQDSVSVLRYTYSACLVFFAEFVCVYWSRRTYPTVQWLLAARI